MTADFSRSTTQTETRRAGLALLAPLLLFLGTLALYLATLTEVHTFDALGYAKDVDQKPWQQLFHPHHLAYGPLGALALKVAQLIGYEGRAALPMQVVNAVAGALGVALCYLLARRVAGRRDVGLVVALLLGGSYAYWYYAVEVEVYTVAAVLLLWCTWLLLDQLRSPTRWRLALLGVVQGGAVLFHQTNLLLTVPLAVALLTPGNGLPSWRERVRGWWAYALALALSVGLPYLWVGFVVSGFRSLQDFSNWSLEYVRLGWWGGPISGGTWGRLGKGLGETFTAKNGALAGLALVGLLLVHLRGLRRAPRPLVAGLAAWLLVYGAFFTWWEPDNIEFWIASLPPLLLLLALALREGRALGPGVLMGGGVALTLLFFNYQSISVRGDASTDLQRQIAAAIGRQSQPSDLLLIPDGLQELYLPYYEERTNFRSINGLMYANGSNWEQACADIHRQIDEAQHAGAAVLIADEVLRPPLVLRQRFGLGQEFVDLCFASYASDLRPLEMPKDAPPAWIIPSAAQRAGAEGWNFDAGGPHHSGRTKGWRSNGTAGFTRLGAGWQLSGDPLQLVGPLFTIDAERVNGIEIDVELSAAGEGRIYYAGPDGAFSPEKSVVWQGAEGRQTLSIPLAGAPGWETPITRLRIDLPYQGSLGANLYKIALIAGE